MKGRLTISRRYGPIGVLLRRSQLLPLRGCLRRVDRSIMAYRRRRRMPTQSCRWPPHAADDSSTPSPQACTSPIFSMPAGGAPTSHAGTYTPREHNARGFSRDAGEDVAITTISRKRRATPPALPLLQVAATFIYGF